MTIQCYLNAVLACILLLTGCEREYDSSMYTGDGHVVISNDNSGYIYTLPSVANNTYFHYEYDISGVPTASAVVVFLELNATHDRAKDVLSGSTIELIVEVDSGSNKYNLLWCCNGELGDGNWVLSKNTDAMARIYSMCPPFNLESGKRYKLLLGFNHHDRTDSVMRSDRITAVPVIQYKMR